MNAVMVTLCVIGTLIFAVGISELQAKLERWDYERHARD